MPPIRLDRDLFLFFPFGPDHCRARRFGFSRGLFFLRELCLGFLRFWFSRGLFLFLLRGLCLGFPLFRPGCDLFLLFPFGPNHCRARRFGSFSLMAEYRRGLMAESMPEMMIGKSDDFVMKRGLVTRTRRRCPCRRFGRTMTGFRPMPCIINEEPSFEVWNVLACVVDIVVFRNPFHDDRRRSRFEDCANQIHDVRRKLNAVAWTRWRLAVVAGEGRRGEDDRCSECNADDECFVESLLDRVSYW